MVEFLLAKQIGQLSPALDKQLLTRIHDGHMNKFESHNDFNLITFDWQNVLNINEKPRKIMICQWQERLVFICADAHMADHVKRIVADGDLPGKILHAFFFHILRPDMDHLEALEERITEMENVLLKDKHVDYVTDIIAVRKELLQLKRYYEQLDQIFEGLWENENGLIGEEELKMFRFLDKRIDRFLTHIVNLRDYITQVREAYQTQIDIEQNGLMKVFTVVATIFLPLTLIVGWYGMNLKMPEVHWKYGYPAVILLCLAVVFGMIAYFKRKKWF